MNGEDVRSKSAGSLHEHHRTFATPAGCLIALRTKAEVDSHHVLGEAFVLKAHATYTAAILRVIDSVLEPTDRAKFAHLRRVIREKSLPLNVHRKPQNTSFLPCKLHEHALSNSTPSSVGSAGKSPPDERPLDSANPLHLYMLLCITSAIPYDALCALLGEAGPLSQPSMDFDLFTVQVPITSPSSVQEALQWSRDFWPTIYKKHNPLGPQDSVISRAVQDVCADVEDSMALAESAGQATYESGTGEKVGAVIVDRTGSEHRTVNVVCGDARWERGRRLQQSKNGNVMAHAVMRAIGMVARMRRESSGQQGDKKKNHRTTLTSFCANGDTDITHFAEAPVTPLEESTYSSSTITPGGYLCLDLELYVTHEPCVMCCMAILHSRFARVIFGVRMARTGGLVAELDSKAHADQSGYGLFWQSSLNWKFLALQWIQQRKSDTSISHEGWHA